MSEQTVQSSEHFLLIEDFRLSLQKSTFRIERMEDSDEIVAISERMINAVSQCTDKLRRVDIADVWESLRKAIDHAKEFVVSLDGDFIIRDPDAVIETTRAASTIEEAEAGKFIRIPRSIQVGMLNQVKRTQYLFERQEKGEIVLFDDGLGTGRTIARVVELFEHENLKISRIVVLANPHKFKEILGVPVNTVIDVPENSIWLNERDLYWGLPRSGVSLIPTGSGIVGLGGVPYTSSETLIANRIGLDKIHIKDFRRAALEANETLWSTVSKFHARTYSFRDVPRLTVFAEAAGIDVDRSIAQYIRELLDS